MKPPIPENESERLKALRSYHVLDTESEQEYDDITLLASQICGTPIAIISLVDKERQWFKSKVGLDAVETSRDMAFCAYAILPPANSPMVVRDALQDERFADNPLVRGDPNIRFYAGAPLLTPDNFAIGTLCVIDREPRDLTTEQIESLEALARQVTLKLELRRMAGLLQKANDNLQNLTLTDDLTGLYNRRGFFLHADQQLKLFRSRKTRQGLWLMLADLDKLKLVNDQFGHQEGSSAIIEAGKILRKTFRDSDIVARFGGDEFVILIINTIDEIKEKITDRLENNLTKYNVSSAKQYEISISYGLIPFVFDSTETIEQIIEKADIAMYEQKRNKKFRVPKNAVIKLKD